MHILTHFHKHTHTNTDVLYNT